VFLIARHQSTPEAVMPRGDKDKYTDKQKRKAEHIANGYENRGAPEERAEAIAWPKASLRITRAGWVRFSGTPITRGSWLTCGTS
jgi:hypothetical protein